MFSRSFESDPFGTIMNSIIDFTETPDNKKRIEKIADSYNKYFFWSDYKKNTPASKRLDDSIRIINKHPNCVPIVLEYNGIHKLLIKEDTPVAHFLISIRKSINISADIAVFLYNDEGSVIGTRQTIREVYQMYMMRHNVDDYFLHLRMVEESTFG